MGITPVILSGGSGSRLWPASRACHPKQFLSLTGKHSLLQETMQRFDGVEGYLPPVMVGGEEHRFLIAEQALECGVDPSALLLEPVPKNTAPAIAAAAAWLLRRDSDATMLVMPADHVIEAPDLLAQAARAALPAAADGWLVTFGIKPHAPATGYGYIKLAERTASPGVWQAASFVEKPDLATASRLVEAGECLWNSGLFLFRAAALMAELDRHAPDVAEAARLAVDRSAVDLDFVRLDEAAFGRSPAISIDFALMQESERVAVAPIAGAGWSDVGSWDSLHEVAFKDEGGNAIAGDALMIESEGNFAHLTDGRLLVALGMKDTVIASTPDALLVAPRSRAQDVKKVVERLQATRPELVASNRRIYRPWGHYDTLHLGHRHQVKHLCVKPGGRLSLQRHYHRAEHWVVVQGTARVTRDDDTCEIAENESIYLPRGCRHRLENPGHIPLSIIEVQTGSYLGEDDIERFEDVYGRLIASASA